MSCNGIPQYASFDGKLGALSFGNNNNTHRFIQWSRLDMANAVSIHIKSGKWQIIEARFFREKNASQLLAAQMAPYELYLHPPSLDFSEIFCSKPYFVWPPIRAVFHIIVYSTLHPSSIHSWPSGSINITLPFPNIFLFHTSLVPCTEYPCTSVYPIRSLLHPMSSLILLYFLSFTSHLIPFPLFTYRLHILFPCHGSKARHPGVVCSAVQHWLMLPLFNHWISKGTFFWRECVWAICSRWRK